MYSFTFKVKIFIKTVAIFIIQHFVDVHNWQIPYSFKIFERFNYFSRIYSFTFQHTFIHIQDQNVYSTQLLNSFNILCASLLLYLLETRGFEDTWIQSIVFQVSRWTLGIGHYLLLGGGGRRRGDHFSTSLQPLTSLYTLGDTQKRFIQACQFSPKSISLLFYITFLTERYGGGIRTKMYLNRVSCHWTINAMPLNHTSFYLLSMLRSDWLSYYYAICYSPLGAKNAGFLAAKKDKSLALTRLKLF